LKVTAPLGTVFFESVNLNSDGFAAVTVTVLAEDARTRPGAEAPTSGDLLRRRLLPVRGSRLRDPRSAAGRNADAAASVAEGC
jgi:hypothetical protein